MVYWWKELIESLEMWGLTDIGIPGLLIFTIVFAILEKTKILGRGKKRFNVMIALVIALSVVVPHVMGTYPSGFDVVEIINMMIPQIALVTVVIVMMLIMIGVFAPGSSGWMTFVGGILVLFLFLGTTEYLYDLNWLFDFCGEETVSLIIMLIIFGLVVSYITAETKGEKVIETGKGILDKLFGE